MEARTPIYCDCHGDVVMGYRVDGKIVWFDTRHGKRHSIAIVVDERAKVDNRR